VVQLDGCNFWYWQRAMGEAGGACAWLRQNPSHMARGLTHLTVAGYQASARLFSQDMQFAEAFK